MGELRRGVLRAQIPDLGAQVVVRGRDEALLGQPPLELRKGLGVGGGINPLGDQQGLGRCQHGAVGLVHRDRILVLLRQEAGLVQFLFRFQNAVVDHFKSAAGAFAGTQVLSDELVVTLPVIVKAAVLLKGRHDRVGDQLFLQLGLAGPVDEGVETLPGLPVAPIDSQEVRDGGRHLPGRQLHRHLADLGRPVHLAPEVQLVVGGDVLAHALAHTVKADRGDVVLRAGIMAAADLDADAREVLRHPAGREDLRHGASQAFGGGDPETASIRARTGDDVLHQLGARISQAVLDQLLVQGLHAGFRHPSNDEILVDGGPEVAVRIDLGQVGHHVHLRRSDITHRQLDDHGGIAGLLLGYDIGPLPHLVGGLLIERCLGRLSVPARPVPP